MSTKGIIIYNRITIQRCNLMEDTITALQEVLHEQIGPMAGFVIKEQMKAAGVDPTDPQRIPLIKMIDLIEDRCLLRLLTPAQAAIVSRKMKDLIKNSDG